MKTKIPDELKKDVPDNKWGKILTSTPVIMTVVATLLASLASSEMTKAQYDRALGAQLQSKAGDQWGYFQAKKMRGAMQRGSLELLEATIDVQPAAIPALDNLPMVAAKPPSESIKTALDLMEHQRPEAEITAALHHVDDAELAATLQAARDAALAFDTGLAPANKVLEDTEKSLTPGDKAAARQLTAAKMRYNGKRYDAEAKLNQNIANLLELQVRRANLSAERHHTRSGKFFMGMLAAQAAVIIATFALAARQKNVLWTVAAVAGLVAIIFAIYVYLRV